jgi:hypothetical protein
MVSHHLSYVIVFFVVVLMNSLIIFYNRHAIINLLHSLPLLQTIDLSCCDIDGDTDNGVAFGTLDNDTLPDKIHLRHLTHITMFSSSQQLVQRLSVPSLRQYYVLQQSHTMVAAITTPINIESLLTSCCKSLIEFEIDHPFTITNATAIPRMESLTSLSLHGVLYGASVGYIVARCTALKSLRVTCRWESYMIHQLAANISPTLTSLAIAHYDNESRWNRNDINIWIIMFIRLPSLLQVDFMQNDATSDFAEVNNMIIKQLDERIKETFTSSSPVRSIKIKYIDS